MGRFIPAAFAILVLLAAVSAEAQQSQRWGTVGLSLVRLEGISAPVAETGTRLELDDGFGATFDWSFSFSRRFAFSLGLSLARHDIETVGGLFPGLNGGTIWAAPVTAGVHYTVPLVGRYEPYVGAGVCGLTMFLDDPGTEVEGVGLAEYRADVGVGPYLEAGLRYYTGNRWHMALGLRLTDVESDLELRDAAGGVVDTVTVDMSPTIVTFAAGYRF